MNAYWSFCKKETLGYWRTYKTFIMLIIFALLGIMNPVTAKLTPELLKNLVPAGMEVKIPTPSALDSWTQFYKNIPQMGLLVLVIVFCGIMTNEFNKHTLVLLLTKGLSRTKVILAKFTMSSVLWTISYALCYGITYGYTSYFWPNDQVPNLFMPAGLLWLFGEFLLAILIFCGILFTNISGTLVSTGAIAVILMIINIAPTAQKYNPLSLSTVNLSLLVNQPDFSTITPAIFITIGAIIVILIASGFVIKHKNI